MLLRGHAVAALRACEADAAQDLVAALGHLGDEPADSLTPGFFEIGVGVGSAMHFPLPQVAQEQGHGTAGEAADLFGSVCGGA